MMLFSLPLAVSSLVAGILMFFAPCTLPIVPGFLAYLSGTDEGELRMDSSFKLRKKLFFSALMFCIGFAVVFISFGVLAGLFGQLLGAVRPLLSIFAGVMITLFGVGLLVSYSFNAFARFRLPVPRFTLERSFRGSLFFGMLFALGFTPCIGPILASVLLLASSKGSILYGTLLLSIFSIGFSLPFLATALAYSTVAHFIHTHARAAHILYAAGGVILILIGIPLILAPFGIGIPFSLLNFAPFSFLAQFY